MRKRYLFILLMIIALVLTGCSSSSSMDKTPVDSADFGEGEDYKESDISAYSAMSAENSDSAGMAADTNSSDKKDGNPENTEDKNPNNQNDVKAEKKAEKLVYRCSLDIETTEYKETMESIQKVIQKYSGIIDSQNESDNDNGWYEIDHEKTRGTMTCNIIVRVPSKDFNSFLNSMEGKGKMTNKSLNVENISRTYYDTEATIESLKIQEKRLLDMMKDADNVQDMIHIEDRLTEVQSELNSYKTQLSIMDTDVAYSTITINVNEVLEYKEPAPGKKTNKFSQRLINTITESWEHFLSVLEELLFAIIHLMPFAILVGIILIPILLFSKKNSEKRKKAKEEFFRKKKEKYVKKEKDEKSENEE